MNKLGELFENYSKEAVRLELLPYYKVPHEWDDFQHYLKTNEAKQNDDLIEYLNDIRLKVDIGAQHIRLRVIDVPLTQYEIFETKIGYIPAKEVGAIIRFIDRDVFDKVVLTYPQFHLMKDFWLFDETDVAFMNYNNDNEWTGFEIGDNVDVKNCCQLKEVLLSKSYELSDLLVRENL